MTTRFDPAVNGSARYEATPHAGKPTLAGLLTSPEGPDRGHDLINLTTQREGRLEQPISTDVSVARGLLDRDGLLQMVDRAVTKRVTVISAPPGSGKTSLLRGWADRSTNLRPVAFVSVERDEQDAQRFWSAVLDAIQRQ